MSGTGDSLLSQYGGEIVPQYFNAGFIAMSYAVSLIGASCTLELLNRRTSHKGRFNHLLLVGSAVAMGGISIWCMHFIGNRAVTLGQGEPELQIAYSSKFTALSFFVPIVVLLAAFVAIGINDKVSWWRVTIGGVMAGAAICGMHYLGNSSIENYICIYQLANIIGSALIAVAASIVSLALFFVFRAAWTNTWWKRAACAVVLAGAVSGMHWCAATGTRYRLVSLSSSSDDLSRNTTVIVVICLSILACLIMAGVAIYTARVLRRYANKAQKVVLAAAVFDKDGRILVNPDGLLPSEKITDSFIEKNASDSFSIAHPLFHWMFRASRDWQSISPLVGGMAKHLAYRGPRDKDPREAIELIDEQGEMIADYDLILRELFCVAATGLAEKMKQPLGSIGILWDNILSAGRGGPAAPRGSEKQGAADDLAEKGLQRNKQQEIGRGSLMFLVRRAQEEREVARLTAAGYRFAELRQVSGIIGSSMQIKCEDFASQLESMATYADDENRLAPGVHLGFFGIRARVGSYGFDVLVRREARNLLPSVQLPLDGLEPWHLEQLQQLDGLNFARLSKRLEALGDFSTPEVTFTTQLHDAFESLRSWIGDPIFDEAALSPRVVTLPGMGQESGGDKKQTISMIALRLVIPIHVKVASARCEFTPLSFFKVHQLVGSEGSRNTAFAQAAHREFAYVARSVTAAKATMRESYEQSTREGPWLSRMRRFGRSGAASHAVDSEGNPVPTALRRSSSPRDSNDSGSTLKLWPGRRHSDNNSTDSTIGTPSPTYGPSDEMHHPSTFGGIMVSEEIRVEVHDANELASQAQAQNRSLTRVPALLSRGIGRGHGSSPSGGNMSMTGGGELTSGVAGAMRIEMKSLAEGGTNAHAEAVALESKGEGEKMVVEPTFVDDLFTICINGR